MSKTLGKVLILETDEKFSGELVDSFQNKSLEVVKMRDGYDANALVDIEAFNIIVTHTKLYRMSGLQVANTARLSAANSQSVIIVLCDGNDDASVKRATKAGVTECLRKPVPASLVTEKAIAALPKKSDSPYDVRIVNAFITSINSVFQAYFPTPPAIGKAVVKKSERAVGYMSTLIDYNGNGIRGSMAISFEKALLIAFAKQMLPHLEGATPDDSALADLAGEMGNQVCGAVKLQIGKLGLKVMVGLPKVVHGKDHSILHIVKNPTLLMLVNHDSGRCTVEFCMTRVAVEEPESIQPNDDAQGGDVLLF